jgi:hypothetical protein
MTAIRYCANRCTRRTGDTRTRVQLPSGNPSRICGRCEKHLTDWLRDIPTNYALLPGFIHHGTTEPNPGSKATKRSEEAAPMRLGVIDLLDQRHARKWLGLVPTEARRGAIGTLHAHADRVRDERPLTGDLPDTVTGLCGFLARHLLWIAEQDWVVEFTIEVKALNRAVAEAVGIYQRPPVGKCHITTDDGTPCGGPLYASEYAGVSCHRCQATWDPAHLRQLGMAQEAV